jgi:hypothetical protein
MSAGGFRCGESAQFARMSGETEGIAQPMVVSDSLWVT